jgi:ribosomal protein L34E
MVVCPETFTAELMDALPLSVESINFVQAVCVAVKTMAEETGYPVFVKNSFTSFKHDWKDSCSFNSADKGEVLRKISSMAHYLSQAPTPYAGNVIVREMIPTEPVFLAFNEMPITQEFRIFARDGKVEAYQPYWPHVAFEKHEPTDCADWSERLEAIKSIKPSDLKELIKQSEAVTKKLGGYWSVDFLKDKTGKWWLIDMAEGALSYVNRADLKVIKPREQEPLVGMGQ